MAGTAHPGERVIIWRVDAKVAGLDRAPDGADLPVGWELVPAVRAAQSLIEPGEQLAGALGHYRRQRVCGATRG